MNTQQHTLIRTLKAHGIDYRIERGRVLAADDVVLFGTVSRTWENISDWTTDQLRAWLGYREGCA